MHHSAIVAALAGLAAASPLAALEAREPKKCPNIVSIGGTDSENSLCCVYGQSIAHCCRNKPFADDDYWSHALPCESEWFTSENFGLFYVCQVTPCDPRCKEKNVPYVFTGGADKNCPK